MKRFAALLLILAGCLSMQAQGTHWIYQAIGRAPTGVNAQVLPYAQVLVCVAGTNCSQKATVYVDFALTTPAPNPVIADGNGNYDYYVPAACYDEQISSPGTTTLKVFNVCTGGVGSFLPLTGGTISGNLLVTGTVTIDGPLTASGGISTTNIGASGNVTIGGNLMVTGTTTMTNLLTASGGINTTSITGMTTPLSQSEGGTGTASGTGYAYGNGTSGFTYSTTIPWSSITGTPATGVSSVFGRTGAIVAQFGDYSFTQLSGSPTAAQIGPAGTLSNSISGNAATATALAATPSQCTGIQFAQGIAANGNANCATIPGGTFTGTSGSQILPSGLILEWGMTPTFDTGPQAIAFSPHFPNAVFQVYLTDNHDCNTTSRIWSWGGATTSGFNAFNDGNGCASWYAVGY